MIRTKRELCLALVAAYERAGAPCLSDTRLTPGRKPLPRTTAWRIVNGKGLPTSTEQLITFLTACGIRPVTQHKYFEAYIHVIAQRGPRRPSAAHRTARPSPVHPAPPARGRTHFNAPLARALMAFADSLPRIEPDALAPALTALADSVPRIEPDALTPALTALADRVAPLNRLVNQEAHLNGTAAPGWTLALSHFAELSRAATDKPFTAGADDTGIDLIARTGDGNIQLYQAKSRRGRPGPPPAGTRVSPPTRPAPAARAR
ncbi:hypothetical protein ACFQ64_19490 [Streptomyces sp. NPDC056460]|uniref:hypothetical protein n=1 Tax=Streptomyces sp. NPDC056460 TaxID=3345825 RepID=UPI0036CDE037